ncbi:glucokinase [Thalassotalea atypica]|uniref:glucokinase n=1 Tax=Thalassotalea atypica TaxID=2054316 RepID=UPI0025731B60|nr:glucokinase [Thalassotalea atypica]
MGNSINLVADIGGTNIRIGLSDSSGNIDALSVYQCNQYPSLSAVISQYLSEQQLEHHDIHACLAIACPVENDLITMTNLPWEFSRSQLKQELQLKTLLLINDYTAIAHAIPLLSDNQKVKIGQGEKVAGKPISICGPGTGLGVANLISDNGKWISLSGEGGHVDFAPIDRLELDILRYLHTKYSHVSYEQLLSGLGIEQIYQAIAWSKQLDVPVVSAEEISKKALTNDCELCSETLAQFCRILGSFAGNLALTLGSFGGVYIAGGIVPRFIDYFNNSEFRKRFEEKGRLSGFNQNIPTYVITESQPGILGAASYLLQFNKEAL